MIEIEIKEWKDYSIIIEKFIQESSQDIRYIFRGQPNSNWPLETSLGRIVAGSPKSEEKALNYEMQSKMEFLSLSHLTNEKLAYDLNMSDIALSIDMQHYSCPTRFLDWSRSPYVALYFAVNDLHNCDCAFFVWDYWIYQQNKDELYPSLRGINIHELLSHNNPDYVEMVIPTKKNERIYRQQGMFSVSNNIIKPHCEIINQIGKQANNQSGLLKLLISKDLKLEFLDRLKFMNINASSLFPGLDGIGREIKENLILRKFKNK